MNHKVKRLAQKANNVKGALVAAGTTVITTIASAAPVELPATAEADITGSVTNGGTLYIAVILVVLGFLVIGKMIKRI